MTTTLILLAHPNLSQSRCNQALIETLEGEAGITVHDLYESYPDPNTIDAAREQQLLLEHDRIVFQFPLYWYSTPGLFKYWQDRVLEYGFAYGKQGDKLADKPFRIVTTAGGAEAAYQHDGAMHATIDEVLKPLETMAVMTRMRYASPFVLYGALMMSDEALAEQAQAYRAMLLGERW